MAMAMTIRLLVLSLLTFLTTAKSLASPEILLTKRDPYNTFLAKRTALSDCLAEAKIKTSLPSSATWASDIHTWNTRIKPIPAAVIFPTDEKQVSAAIKCAATTKTKVTTLGGNRSFASMGFGRNDGALIINLKSMKVLKFNEAENTLTYGGPVTIAEAAKFVWEKHTRAVMHGRCPDVGMTGIAFGGGFGTLSRMHGTLLDDIVAVRAVLANGDIVDASESENKDLFWAVRGAASSVASVLTVTVKTFEPPSQQVVSYTIGFPKEDFKKNRTNVTLEDCAQALVGMQNWALSADNVENLSIRYKIAVNASLAGFFYGSEKEWEKVSRSLLKHLPKMKVLNQEEVDFWTSENLTTPGLLENSITEDRYFYITSLTIPASHPLTLPAAKALLHSTAFAPKPKEGQASGLVDLWGGALAKSLKPDATAWRHNDNLLLVRWDLRNKESGETFTRETMLAVRKWFYKFVEAYEASGGVLGGFPNYRDAEWTFSEMSKFLFGENWARLLKVKQAVDPGNLFSSDPQAVSVVNATMPWKASS